MKYEIRDVVGYENLYMIDTEGNVFRVKKDGLKLLKPVKNNKVATGNFFKVIFKSKQQHIAEAITPNAKEIINVLFFLKEEKKLLIILIIFS